ncbi:unnamed protein product [Trichogramma brassicae]|uniref:Uncharacterized protein n=1 Tax=Trichogramma brassicae TaxID=86971 RepID=A0A6H5IS97_9HYME|nr:unnamed protein product [Trichogramma brassicae]
MVCAVRPRCVQNPSSPTPSIVPVRPPSTIDLVSLEDDDEPIIVCEVFHARRPTTPRHIRHASVIIIEPAASPPGSSVTSPSLSLESRPPSPLRFSSEHRRRHTRRYRQRRRIIAPTKMAARHECDIHRGRYRRCSRRRRATVGPEATTPHKSYFNNCC